MAPVPQTPTIGNKEFITWHYLCQVLRLLALLWIGMGSVAL
jgi:hypothetical protein